MRAPNLYTQLPLDRAAKLRKDAAGLEAAQRHPDSRFVPVWRRRSLIQLDDETVAPLILTTAEVEGLLAADHPLTLLGTSESGAAHFSLDLSSLEEPLTALGAAAADGGFHDLRDIGPILERGEAALLAYARGLQHWHSQHLHCGICGAPSRSAEGGHVRQCTNAACNAQHFPRTDPAVIMLVHEGDSCLLGRNAGWPAGVFSTLAGFVEPGESLEEAVGREVFEESGVLVSEVVYHSSQPWPFPASIMLGFWAQATTREIEIAPDELEDAIWVTRDQLRQGAAGGVTVPPPSSISGRLIEDWVALDGQGALPEDAFASFGQRRSRKSAAG